MSTIKVAIPGPGVGTDDRYVLVRTDGTPATRVRFLYHGGGNPPGGSSRMLQRIPAVAGVVDIAGEGIARIAPDGTVTTGWIVPDRPFPGFVGTEDVTYTIAAIRWAQQHYPLPMYVLGFSNGAEFWQDAMFNWSKDIGPTASPLWRSALGEFPFRGVAIIKNTPLEAYLVGGHGSAFSTPDLPPLLASWFSAGDTKASQSPPHETFTEALATWKATYGNPPMGQGVIQCGAITVDVWTGSKLYQAMQRTGEHTSAWSCIGNRTDQFFATH